MARKLKTYQTSLGFFDQAIAAERIGKTLVRQERPLGEAEAKAGPRRAPGPQIPHGEGERRQGPLPAAVVARQSDPNQGKKILTPS